MKNLEDNLRRSIQEFKVYNLNKLIQLRRQQKEYFELISIQKSMDDWLTVNDLIKEFGISRKTFDRWRIDGLKVYQKKPKAVIIVQRKDIINYLKK
nr:hypothetical protein [uncultured Psychroserpens sp.]